VKTWIGVRIGEGVVEKSVTQLWGVAETKPAKNPPNSEQQINRTHADMTEVLKSIQVN